MRLLFLTHNMKDVGGSYVRAFSLARGMAFRGHDVTLMAARQDPGMSARWTVTDKVEIFEPIDVAPRRIRHGGLSPMDISGRVLAVRNRSVDLIHAFDHRPAVTLPARQAANWHGAPIVSDWADLWGLEGIASERPILLRGTLGRFDHLLERRWRASVAGVTVASSSLYDRCVALGVDENRLLRLPPGSNLRYLETGPKAQARAAFGVPTSSPVIAHVGYAAYDEDLLVDTFLELARRMPKANLLTAGREPTEMSSRLALAGWRERWTHVGTVPYPKLGLVCSAADVLLLPYAPTQLNLGRFPNKIGDYLAAGRPIVTNPTGDVAELVQSEAIGRIAEASPQAMAKAVIELLANPAQAEQMGARARTLATGRLSWDALAAEVEAFYKQLAA